MILYFSAVWLVVMQGIMASLDGYFSEEQMIREHPGRPGWSFLQHGGMYADVMVGAPGFRLRRFQILSAFFRVAGHSRPRRFRP